MSKKLGRPQVNPEGPMIEFAPIRMTADLKRSIEKLARRQRTSMSWIVRDALYRYVEQDQDNG